MRPLRDIRTVLFYHLPEKYRRAFSPYITALRELRLRTKIILLGLLLRRGRIRNINIFEARVYSQQGEDGIIQAIFKKIGVSNRYCVEFGVGDGSECNTRYLIEKFGWRYLHMDGDLFPESATDVKREHITAENINSLFAKYCVPKEFDLLSIDLDYNTYWVFKALENYYPRVVIVEYNASIPANESKAVPYDPNGKWDGSSFFGASLAALVKVAKKKGYVLIGCESRGVNAFFVRRDIARQHFVERNVIEAWKPPKYGTWVGDRYIGHPPPAAEERKFVVV